MLTLSAVHTGYRRRALRHQTEPHERARVNTRNTGRCAPRFASAAPRASGCSSAGIAAWAALTVADRRARATPAGARCCRCSCWRPLFEAVFALHIGVERIGRYIQVFSRGRDGSGLGARGHGVRSSDSAPRRRTPLFAVPFLAGRAVQPRAGAARSSPTRVELVFVGGAHALFVAAPARRAPGGREAARDRSRPLRAASSKACDIAASQPSHRP